MRVEPSPGQPWRTLNGWKLLDSLPVRPHLASYDLALRAVIDNNTINSVATATADLDDDGDLYVLASSLAVWDPIVTDEEGFGRGVNNPLFSPYTWPAHVQITESAGGRSLSNQPVSVGAIFGRAGRPFYMPAPWKIKAGSRITARLTNNYNQPDVGDAAEVIITLSGLRRYTDGPDLRYDFLLDPRLISALRDYREAGIFARPTPYFYSLFTGHDALEGGAGAFIPMASESPSFTVTQGDFLCTELMAEIFDDAGQGYFKKFENFHVSGGSGSDHLIQLLVDQETRLQQQPVAVEGWFGHGKRHLKLARPLRLKEGQTLTAVVSPGKRPQSAANHWKGRFTFGGVKMPRMAS